MSILVFFSGYTSVKIKKQRCKTLFSLCNKRCIVSKNSVSKYIETDIPAFLKKTRAEIMRNTSIKRNNAVVNWCNYIGNYDYRYMRLPELGSIGKRILIDESLFHGRRKYHRDRLQLCDFNTENKSEKCARRRNYWDVWMDKGYLEWQRSILTNQKCLC